MEEFQKFPSIGPKSAQRMSFHVLNMSPESVKNLAAVILEAKEKIRHCKECFNLSAVNPCEICSNPRRDPSIICVVADPRDLIALERTCEFKGLYHVLNGLISPLEGRGPEQLSIHELIERVMHGSTKEIILAINPTVEGDATVLYLCHLLKPSGIKLTRIAFGLPIGSDLEYADDITLIKALEGRREL